MCTFVCQPALANALVMMAFIELAALSVVALDGPGGVGVKKRREKIMARKERGRREEHFELRKGAFKRQPPSLFRSASPSWNRTTTPRNELDREPQALDGSFCGGNVISCTAIKKQSHQYDAYLRSHPLLRSPIT
jgi:hypothetical protein